MRCEFQKSSFIPTSTTLLRQLAADSRHSRWTEFVARYEPLMHAYLRTRFPFVEADDVVSETLVALVDVLAHYRYDPQETGRFHNYLTGVLRHKALRACRAADRNSRLKAGWREDITACAGESASAADEEAYRQALFEIAVSSFFSDPTIAPRTKEVFRRTAIAGESPETVAQAFQMSRHAVDQIKSRSVVWLRKRIDELEQTDD